MSLPDRKTQAVIATNRFGLGARDGEIRDAESDPRGWVREQLTGPAPTSLVGEADLWSSRDAHNEFFHLLTQRQQMDKPGAAPPQTAMNKAAMNKAAMSQGGPRPAAFSRDRYNAEILARTETATVTTRPMAERMVWFWSNHFTVSGYRTSVAPIAGAFEREAIRPHVFGRFEDMLLAVTFHPAMMLYLDQQKSIGPNSPRGQRNGQGLNENLGREVLELHTLGVDGGYTQKDVTTFAKALTGWTVGGSRRGEAGDGTALYLDAIHEPGDKTILGRTYADSGRDQAVEALRDFAAHPATARHVALKLARHFIADDPPDGAVAALAGTFRDTGGDLRALSDAVVGLDAAWGADQRKVKTSQEYIVSSLRGLEMAKPDRSVILSALLVLDQPPFSALSPIGWPDRADDLAGPDALYRRIKWAVKVGQLTGQRVGDPAQLARSMLGAAAGQRLADALGHAGSRTQAVALLLSSPEFQRR